MLCSGSLAGQENCFQTPLGIVEESSSTLSLVAYLEESNQKPSGSEKTAGFAGILGLGASSPVAQAYGLFSVDFKEHTLVRALMNSIFEIVA